MSKTDFRRFSREIQRQVDAVLERFLKEKERKFRRVHPLGHEIIAEVRRSLKGGKRLRPALVVIGYLAGGGRNIRNILPAAAGIELFHLYTLLHDDIMDRSPVRRGKPASYIHLGRLFKDEHLGVALAILIGSILKTFSDELLGRVRVGSREFKNGLDYFTALKNEVELGQYLDLRLQQSKRLTESDVIKIITHKTAKNSFERPLHIGAALAGARTDIIKALSRYALPLGVAFQIQDDILGVFGNEKETGKPTDSDIKEGKPTLLKSVALKNTKGKEKAFLLKTLGNPSATARNIERVRQIFRSSGAYDAARQRVERLIKKATQCLRDPSIPRQPNTLLAGLADFLENRKT